MRAGQQFRSPVGVAPADTDGVGDARCESASPFFFKPPHNSTPSTKAAQKNAA